jgi:hypothetical protein
MKAATADGTVEPTPDEAVRDNSDGDIAARASAGWFSSFIWMTTSPWSGNQRSAR